MTDPATEYTGGCLCGHIRYRITGAPDWPHYCSCTQCQKWSGAPVVAWVDFPLASITYDGPGGAPAMFRSSKKTRRGCCPQCGGSICALDDGADTICITMSSLDDNSGLTPESHSFRDMAPDWLTMKRAV